MLTVAKAVDPHQIADRLYPKLAKQIRAALDAMRDAGDLDALQIPDEVRAAIRDIYRQIAAGTAAETAAALGVNFNSVNPAVVSWAETSTGKLITMITEETRSAIQQAVIESLRQGTGTQPLAQQLRQYIGLNGPQARALARFEASFDTPSPRLVERRANRMLRQRAEMIARTETITASNMGQQITWTSAADAGMIPRSSYKEWLATNDERTCPICNNMDGTRVPYNDTYMVTTRFDSDGGALNMEPSTTPPAHPSCRCTMVLVEGDATQPAPKPIAQTDVTLGSLDDLKAWGEARGIEIDPKGLTDADLPAVSEVLRAVDDAIATNPLMSGKWSDHPSPLFAGKQRGLTRIEFGAGQFGETANVLGSPGRPSSKMRITSLHPSGKNVVGDSIYDAITHEMGHVAHNSLMNGNSGKDLGDFTSVIRRARKDIWRKGRKLDTIGIRDDISIYAMTNEHEFFAEVFAVRSLPEAAARLSAEARQRIGDFADIINAEARQMYGINFDVL